MVGQPAFADIYLYHRQLIVESDGDADAETDGVAHPGAYAYRYAGAYIAAGDADAQTHGDTHNSAGADAFAGVGYGQRVACGCGQRVGNVDLDAWRERYDALCGGNQAVRFVGGADYPLCGVHEYAQRQWSLHGKGLAEWCGVCVYGGGWAS